MSENFNRNIHNTFESFIMGILQERLHTGLPGKILAYDAGNKKAEIEILLKKKYEDSSELSFPTLYNVPVYSYIVGDSGLYLPEKEYVDQECWVLFAERDIDRWKNSGALTYPNSSRKFSVSDAVAICSLDNFKKNNKYTDDNLHLYYGDTSINIKENSNIELDTTGNIDLGSTPLLGVARNTDSVSMNTAFGIWIGQVTAAINALAPGSITILTNAVIGNISSASSKVKSV